MVISCPLFILLSFASVKEFYQYEKTTMPGMPEVEVVEIKTSAPVNVPADPAPAKAGGKAYPQDRCGKDNCSQD